MTTKTQSIALSGSEIADALAAEVHNGLLKEGDMFPSERELCDRFSVGRTVIREGMTILNGIKLVDHTKGKRPRVMRPSLSDVMVGVSHSAKFFFDTGEGRAHLEQARLFMENSMLLYAVEHATHAHVARLIAIIDECDASVGDMAKYRDADVRFHRVLAEIPGNPIFLALHESFVAQLMRSRPMLANYEEHNKNSTREHRQIVEAIINKDVELAVATLNEHLGRTFGVHVQQSLKQDK